MSLAFISRQILQRGRFHAGSSQFSKVNTIFGSCYRNLKTASQKEPPLKLYKLWMPEHVAPKPKSPNIYTFQCPFQIPPALKYTACENCPWEHPYPSTLNHLNSLNCHTSVKLFWTYHQRKWFAPSFMSSLYLIKAIIIAAINNLFTCLSPPKL